MTDYQLLSADNHLFELARSGRLRVPASLSERGYRIIDRGLYPLAVLVFSLLTPLLAAMALIPLLIIGALVGDSSYLPAVLAETGVEFAQLVAAFLPFYLLVWGWLWLFERRLPWTTGLEWPGWLAKYARGLLIGLLLFVAAIALLALFGNVSLIGGDPGTSRLMAGGGALVLLLGWMVQGGAEELLLRGFLLPIFGARFGAIPGILVSSILFTLLHLLNPNLSWLALLNLFLFGFFAALFALFEGGLWGIFAIHTIWNWAQGNLFGLSVSGGESSVVTIFSLSISGPDWLTGGNFGPEGGLAVTAVLICAMLVLATISFYRRN